MSKQKVVLNVDTGVDDAQAIMLAVSGQRAELLAVLCSMGNVGVEQAEKNTRRVLEVCQRSEVIVQMHAPKDPITNSL